MEKPKVLVGAPVYRGVKYCLKEFLTGVRNLSYENFDVLIVDNSKGDEFFEELKKEEGSNLKVLKDDTEEEKPIMRLISSRNKILEYALEGGYDYIFMMDADIVAPSDIIEGLLECEKDIVSGLYFGYFGVKKTKMLSIAWMPITKEEFEIMRKQVTFPSSIRSHEDLNRHLTQKEIDDNELLEVLYPSAGCMLISRKVFEKVRYGLLDAPEGKVVSDDIYFFKKAREAGFKLYCYTKYKCDHLLEGKYKRDKRGNLLHPLLG